MGSRSNFCTYARWIRLSYMDFAYIIILQGFLEGILLRYAKTTGPKIFLNHFSLYHFILAVFILYVSPLYYLPLAILLQDLSSNITSTKPFFGKWIMWPFDSLFLGFPFIYWTLGTFQLVICLMF